MMISTNASPGVTPISVLQGIVANMGAFKKGAIFVVGVLIVAVSLYLAVLDARENHGHSVVEAVERGVILLWGVAMMMPETVLAVLAAIPLPSFMHREPHPPEDKP